MDEFSLKCKQFLLDTEQYKSSDRIRVFAYPAGSDYTNMEVRKMFHKGLGSPIITVPTKEIEYWEMYKMKNEKLSKIKQLIGIKYINKSNK